MSFTISQKKRFYHVYPQDSLTTVGLFSLKGSLMAQLPLPIFGSEGEITNVHESKDRQHAEEIFIEAAKGAVNFTPPDKGDDCTLSLSIIISYSPCSMCRNEILTFFGSLPRHEKSCYNLDIQFANLYHESNSSTTDEIQKIADWGRSLQQIGVNTTFQPLCVTKHQMFDPIPLGITPEKIEERKKKDKDVSLQIQQIMKRITTLKEDTQLSHELETKLSLKESAEELKVQGNAAYGEGNLHLAIKLYTRAIKLDPSNHVLYSNRSMAHCKARKYERALKDAEASIHYNAKWTKGYHHKGRALTFLGRYSEAANAYEQALKLQPRNQELKDALSAVNDKLVDQRIAKGLSKAINAPARPPTRAKIRQERTKTAMQELHSEKKINDLLKTGNNLANIPPAIRKALSNCTSKQAVSSNEILPKETYVVHREKIKLPDGSSRCLNLSVRLEFSHETVSGSGRVKIITRYYNLIYEWK